MFVNFLNKTHPDVLDLSVLVNYPPDKVLFYFVSSGLTLPLDYYITLKEKVSAGIPASPAADWLHLIEQILDASEDLLFCNENDFLDNIGPYYYPFTNTRFFFNKTLPSDAEFLTSSDIDILEAFQQIAIPEPAVQAYGRNKKGIKRYSRNKEEILRDVKMCLLALNQIERLHKQINFWQKIMEQRQLLLSEDDRLPEEPGNPPHKPEKPVDSNLSGGRWFPFSRKSKRQQNENNKYQRQLKVYYIRYREYEKACDRFKSVLESWPDLNANFIETCQRDCEIASERLFFAQQYLELYELILSRSLVHPEYQDNRTLNFFRNYLETGRASDLQECMNIFEEESLWNDLKAGQTRIENTIYLLQNDNDHLRWAQNHINEYLHRDEAEEELMKV